MEKEITIGGILKLKLVEVCLKNSSTELYGKIKKYFGEFIKEYKFENNIIFYQDDEYLNENVEYVNINTTLEMTDLNKDDVNFEIYVFQYSTEIGEEEINEEEETIPACKQWQLPNKEFHNLWERFKKKIILVWCLMIIYKMNY
jgi:hypothetical protein